MVWPQIGWGQQIKKFISFLLMGGVYSGMLLGTAHAGPWPQHQGDALLISRTDKYQSETRTEDGFFAFEQLATGLYGEYGLTDRTTVGINLFYTDQQNSGPVAERSAAGFAVADVFIQRQIRRRDYSVWSARLLIGAPTNITRFSSLAGDMSEDRDASLEPGLLYGRTIDARGRHFVTGDIGYRTNFGDDADHVRFDIGYGFRPKAKLLLSLKGYSRTSLQNHAGIGEDVDFVRLEPSVAFETDRFGTFEIGYAQDISTRNMSPGEAVFFSLWTRF